MIRPYSDQLKSQLLFGGNAFDRPDHSIATYHRKHRNWLPFFAGLFVGMVLMGVLWL